MIVYSYDDVLRAPRRMHSFQWQPGGRRHPLPRPVGWQEIGYLAALVLATFVVGRVLPLDRLLATVLAPETSWIVWHLLVPFGLLWLVANAQLDGRQPHLWAYSYACYLLRAKLTYCGERAYASAGYRGSVRFFWDEYSPRLRHGWIRGGRFSSSVPVRFTFSLRHRASVVRRGTRHATATDHVVDGRIEVRP